MDKPKILPLPGNSSREGNFYEEQQPARHVVDPDGNIGFDNLKPPTAPSYPFKITTGGR